MVAQGKTRRRPGVHFGAAGALLLACGLGFASGGAAQDAADRGWLGIYVHWDLDCPWDAEGKEQDCDPVLLVDSVAVEGPAAEAGILPGDKLLAINGQPLVPERQEALLGMLKVGTPTSIDLGRDDVRRFVRVIPAQRPAETERTAWRGLEDVPQRTRAYVVPVKPLERLEDGTVAFSVRSDEEGVVRIQYSTIEIDDGRFIVTPLDDENVVEIRDVPFEVDVAEIRAMSDSIIAEAGERFAELLRISVEYGFDEEVLERMLRGVRLDVASAPVLRGRAVAGAEFETLSPDLASYYEGTDEGLLVIRVLADTPAAKLGLRGGDIVIEAGGYPVTDVRHLKRAIERDDSGETVTVKWIRKGEVMVATLNR